MGIHLPTIVLVIAISSVLNFFMLLGQYLINRKYPGIFYWLCGFALIGSSQFLLYFGGNIDNILKISLGDVMMVGGFLLVSVGLKLFFKFSINKVLCFVLFGFQLVWSFSFNLHRNINLEQVGFFINLTINCLIVATDLYKHYRLKGNATSLILVFLFSIYAALFLFGATLDIININVPNGTPPGLMLSIIFLFSYITSTVATFSFVMLVNHELIADRQLALTALQESENRYRQNSIFLQSVLESPQDIIIFALDTNYCYTKFTSFHKAVMKTIWGVDIEIGTNMLDVILIAEDRQKAKINFDRALSGESFVEKEEYGEEKLHRAYYENRYSPIKNVDGDIIGLSVFVIDITERMLAETEIQQAKNHFETLFKISPDATMITRLPEGTIIDVNDAFESGTGYSREDAVGKTTLELDLWHDPKDRENFVTLMRATGTASNFEAHFLQKGGKVHPGLISAKAFQVKGITHIISITHDLSELRKREKDLHLLQYAISNSTEAVLWIKEDGSFFNANTAACKLFGLNPTELDKTNAANLLPEFRGQNWTTHWQSLKEKKHLNLSTRFNKNGIRQDIEINANYIHYGGIDLLCSFVRNVTESKKEEAEREQVRRNFDALISSTNDLMWSVDSNYNLIAGNKAFLTRVKETIGYELKTGDPLLNGQHYDESYLAYWKRLYDDALTGKDLVIELSYFGKDTDGKRWDEIHLNPIMNGDEVTGVACFEKDITNRKLQEQMMIELNRQIKLRADELSASNRELEQFAYIASHDLQEPLRMVSSFLKLLEKRYQNKLDEKGTQYINFAVDGASRMRQIILDLLEYSRVGKGERPAELVDMNELMEDITHFNSITIQEHKAVISWSNLPVLQAVKLSLQQVLQNLVANALKYHQPDVNPVVKVAATDAGEFWQIEVSDNGIGIEPAFFSKIFVVFQRLHTNESYSGSGIGLSICKKIIEKQGGTIWVESEPGKGSTFFFTIKKG